MGEVDRSPDRNLALELVRVTESAATFASRWIGRGDKIAADQAAVDAMRLMINTVSMRGVVVIGEGEKDEAPMLFNGEEVGDGTGPEVDVAVDPLEGTRLTALGMPNAISVIAVSERGTMFFPGAAAVHGQDRRRARGRGRDRHRSTPTENLEQVAEAKGVEVNDLTVVVLERDRHDDLVAELREAGARVNLIRDGDVAPAIAAAQPGTGVDLLMGVGGTPEGVISAAAIKSLGGAMQGKLWPRDDEERRKLEDAGYDVERVLTADDLVQGDNLFVAATGVTSGALLRGVRVIHDHVETDSLVMRSRSGTVRRIQASIHSRRSRPSRKECGDDSGARAAVRHRPGDRRRQQGYPRRGRELGHDQEAVRRDRRRVHRGEPPRLPRAPLHDARAWRTTSAASSSTTRRSARTPTTARRSRRCSQGQGVVPGIKVDTGAMPWPAPPARR